MAVLPIRIFGDPVLRTRAHDVVDFDDALRKLADDMLQTMRAANGAGLAANQVGVLKRLFTWELGPDLPDLAELDGDDIEQVSADPAGLEPSRFGAVVNPQIVETSEEMQDGDEGCLSFPGLFYPTERPLRVRVKASDVFGNPLDLVGEELFARILLHEIDHLNGVLFIDHLARHDKKEAMRRIREGELERNLEELAGGDDE